MMTSLIIFRFDLFRAMLELTASATLPSVHYNDATAALQLPDPLWDGKGCGPTNTCCSFNTPPWFVKGLASPTTDDLEMRVCRPLAYGSSH